MRLPRLWRGFAFRSMEPTFARNCFGKFEEIFTSAKPKSDETRQAQDEEKPTQQRGQADFEFGIGRTEAIPRRH